MADSPEYLTVKKLQPQLRIGFKNNTADLAIAFNAEGLIDEICYAAVIQAHSTLLPIQKADRMFESVLENVQLSSEKFDMMKIILSRKKINEPIVKLLEEEYANQAKLAGATKNSTKEDKPKQRNEQAPSPPEDVPENFSENFSPEDFAKWMKVRKFMLDKDCDIIKGEGLSGEVFVQLDESDLGEFKLTKAGFINLRGVWRQIKKTQSVEAVAPPVSHEVPSLEEEEQKMTSDLSFNFIFGKSSSISPPKSYCKKSYPASDRGSFDPALKLGEGDEPAHLQIEEPVYIPKSEIDYYPMTAKKHGVCFIINNIHFKNLPYRQGTERDEYNLIQVWRYLGYHVEVRQDVTAAMIKKLFENIDATLEYIKEKDPEIANDSFVCCILSHGSQDSIYGYDGPIDVTEIEKTLGKSATLSHKPKILFIQACQGKDPGAEAIGSCSEWEHIAYRPDGVHASSRSDFFISQATAYGDQAYRHPLVGSVYIRILSKVLCELSKRCTLEGLQKKINERVPEVVVSEDKGIQYRQQSTARAQLQKNVHFFLQ